MLNGGSINLFLRLLVLAGLPALTQAQDGVQSLANGHCQMTSRFPGCVGGINVSLSPIPEIPKLDRWGMLRDSWSRVIKYIKKSGKETHQYFVPGGNALLSLEKSEFTVRSAARKEFLELVDAVIASTDPVKEKGFLKTLKKFRKEFKEACPTSSAK